MKGQHEALSIIMISGILIGVVGSVYFWGLPLIQKNKDIALLENSESFMKNLNEKIKYIANYGGRDEIKITLPVLIKFNPDKTIDLIAETYGTIYAKDAEISLGKNPSTATTGIWGINDPEVINVKSIGLSEDMYKTVFSLRYINLTTGTKTYRIDLIGNANSGGRDHYIIIENKGTISDRNLINTIIEISII
ncbi:MAG: hypothetical protein QXD48_01980 [Candidatus Aenigmatarchaeota archaeon]